MRISTVREYRDALDRVNRLRADGHTAETSVEMADLHAAISAYEALPDQPDVSKGKPQSETQPKFDTKRNK